VNLRLAARWAISGNAVDLPNDFIYETYVFLQLLKDCKRSYQIRYVPGSGKPMHAFPKKPSPKAGRPRFELLDKTSRRVVWQLCAGTKISDIVGDERAPDVSLQSPGAPDRPAAVDVHMIWDAKYKKKDRKGSRRITSHDFSEFARWIELFDLRSKASPKIALQDLRSMIGNCLVTNGETSTEKDAELVRTKVREAAGMYPGSSPFVRP
jgi:hypothetical protein